MIRGVIGVLAAVALWQAAVWLTGLPPYLLPGPAKVAQTLAASRAEIAQAALFTAAETLIGQGADVLLQNTGQSATTEAQT